MAGRKTDARPFEYVEDLVALPADLMQILCKNFDGETLMVALKTAPEEVRETIFSGFPPRRAGVLGDTLPAVGPVTLEQIEAAQRQLVEAANTIVAFRDILDD